jgi:hypothetical protein
MKNISWESHLMGLLAGVILAIYYRGYGPQRKRYDWEDEEDDDELEFIDDTNPDNPDNPDNPPPGNTNTTGPENSVYT